jgi:hypothetical protein
MEERSIIKCKRCNLLKIRILKKKIGKEKIWADENGKQWNGATCSDCHIEICRLKMQVKRAKDEL